MPEPESGLWQGGVESEPGSEQGLERSLSLGEANERRLGLNVGQVGDGPGAWVMQDLGPVPEPGLRQGLCQDLIRGAGLSRGLSLGQSGTGPELRIRGRTGPEQNGSARSGLR